MLPGEYEQYIKVIKNRKYVRRCKKKMNGRDIIYENISDIHRNTA